MSKQYWRRTEKYIEAKVKNGDQCVFVERNPDDNRFHIHMVAHDWTIADVFFDGDGVRSFVDESEAITEVSQQLALKRW